MRITAYSDRLLEDLNAPLAQGVGKDSFTLDWPEAIKSMQANWIGRSEGAEVLFDVLDNTTGDKCSSLKVFTTRPDTLFGATFMAVAPEHPLVTPGNEAYNVPEKWPNQTQNSWCGEKP